MIKTHTHTCYHNYLNDQADNSCLIVYDTETKHSKMRFTDGYNNKQGVIMCNKACLNTCNVAVLTS